MVDSDRLIPRGLKWGAAAAVFVACVILYGPGLFAGYLADDLFQISMIEGLYGHYQPWDLYAFARADAALNAEHAARGSLPWWTVPHFRFAMLRPLASLLLYFDHVLFPRDAVIHHLHSGLWFGALLYAAFRFLREVSGEKLALLAVAIFAIDETMVWMVAWLANRCAMISVAFCLVALTLHHRHRRALRRRPGVEFGAWILAFSAGEYALGGLAYLLAYEVTMVDGGPVARLRALWPGLAAAGIFALVYVIGDYGVYGASTYIDPVSDPWAFLGSAGERIPRMAGEVWTGMAGESERFFFRYHHTGLVGWVMPDDGADIVTQAWRHARFALLTSVAFVGIGWVLARRHLDPEERRVVRWMLLGSIACLVPIAAIPPATRALMFANLGASVFAAALLVAAARAWQSAAGGVRGQLRRLLLAAWAIAFAYVHVVREAGYVREQGAALAGAQGGYDKFYGNPPFAALELEGRHVVVIATPGLVTGIHGISMLNLAGKPLPRSWHVLAMGRRPYLVRRLGQRTLELDSVGGPMQLSPQEVLFRSRVDALRLGETVDIGLFEAKVVHEREDLGPDGLVFRFDRSLDDPSLVWLEVGPDGLRPFPLPPRGTTVPIQPPLLPQVVPRG